MSSYPRSALWHFCYRLGLVQAKPWGRPVDYLTRKFVEPEKLGLVKPIDSVQLDCSAPKSAAAGAASLASSSARSDSIAEQLVTDSSVSAKRERIEEITIRPCFRKDYVVLDRLRRENHTWLAKWEAMLPPNENLVMPGFKQFCRQQDRAMCDGNALSMLLEINGKVSGAISIGAVHRESLSVGTLGYWIAEKWANRGITTLAVATVLDLALIELDLHRIEIVVRPENRPSLAVCRKLGLREEGLRKRYMYIGGAWRDHLTFVADQEMVQSARQTFVDRL